MANTLLDRLIKNTTVKEASVLSTSKFFVDKDQIPTSVPMINVALSGTLNGGFVPGHTMFAGPSKNFKTGFSLLLAKAYLDQYPESILLFYDTEFGTPQSYFTSFGIDLDRVLHVPVTDLEQLKFDIMKQLEDLSRKDNIIIVIDSIGNVASKKEVTDALDGKSVADMSRAKQLKSVFRMVTPHLMMKNIPLVTVAHTYQTQGCMSPLTRIRMGDAALKFICDIEPGEQVMTLNGPKEVEAVFTPDDLRDSPIDNGMYELEFEDGTIIKCTGNHKFKIKDGDDEWIQAKDLLVLNTDIEVCMNN